VDASNENRPLVRRAVDGGQSRIREHDGGKFLCARCADRKGPLAFSGKPGQLRKSHQLPKQGKAAGRHRHRRCFDGLWFGLTFESRMRMHRPRSFTRRLPPRALGTKAKETKARLANRQSHRPSPGAPTPAPDHPASERGWRRAFARCWCAGWFHPLRRILRAA